MWFENVVVILTWFIILLLIIKICIKKKNIVSIVIAMLDALCFILYIFKEIILVDINTTIQMMFLLFGYILPLLVVYTSNTNNIIKNRFLKSIVDILYNIGNKKSTIKLYNYIRKNYKSSMDSTDYYKLGKLLRTIGEYSEARDILIEAVEIDKTNYMAYYELGKSLNNLGNKDTAIVMFSNCLKINKEYTPVKIELAIVYSQIGRFKEATSLYNELISANLADEKTWYNLATIKQEEAKTDEAEKCYKEAININNSLYEAWFGLGVINYMKGEYDSAIEAFNNSSKGNGYFEKSSYNLAKCYASVNEDEKSLKILKRIIKKDETYINKIQEELVFDKIVKEII